MSKLPATVTPELRERARRAAEQLLAGPGTSKDIEKASGLSYSTIVRAAGDQGINRLSCSKLINATGLSTNGAAAPTPGGEISLEYVIECRIVLDALDPDGFVEVQEVLDTCRQYGTAAITKVRPLGEADS